MITITIKGIPKETHRELKRRAAAHRRSLNSEVILLLESSVGDVPAGIDRLRSRSKSGGAISEGGRIAGRLARNK